MKDLVNKFYNVQSEIIDQLNEKYKEFRDKKVNIKVVYPPYMGTRGYEFNNIVFVGFDGKSGWVEIKYLNMKKDGTISKRGGSFVLYEDMTANFELVKD